MVNFINFFFILVLLHSELKTKEIIDYKINPELDSGLKFDDTKKGKGEKFVIVSANNYATSSARKIIEAGGNAADAAVTLQLILVSGFLTLSLLQYSFPIPNKPVGVLPSPSNFFFLNPFFPIEHLNLNSSIINVSLFLTFNIIIF